MDHRNGILLFLAGSVAGAMVALLTAPQSGKATRELMERRLRETAGSAREFGTKVVERSAQLRDEASQRVEAVAAALTGHATHDAERASATRIASS